MTLPLPNLDDRTYADLVRDAIAQIPTECPEWTDHNPSDTGIILIELLAWLTEMTLYQVNQIPDRNIASFLSLLKGEEWTLPDDLSADQRQLRLKAEIQSTLKQLERRYRAITPKDFAGLILEDWPIWAQMLVKEVKELAVEEQELLVLKHLSFFTGLPLGIQPLAKAVEEHQKKLEGLKEAVKAELPASLKELTEENLRKTLENPVLIDRVICLPQQKPADSGTGITPTEPRHITLVVVPKQEDLPPDAKAIAKACLKVFLDQRRLLTTHVHVVEYRPKLVTVDATLVLAPDAFPDDVKAGAIAALQKFFHPRTDPENPYWDGKGWPFGRSVYISELYQLLDGVPGVDYVDLIEFKNSDHQALRDGQGHIALEISLEIDQLVQLDIAGSDMITEVQIGTRRHRVY